MLKHATAGAFVFSASRAGEWRLGLVRHPRLGRWVAPGGHVETDESPAQAALREVAEESGLRSVQLVAAPSVGLPAGFPPSHRPVPLPWWITEISVGGDNHLAGPHVHVDHQYVAIAPDPDPAAAGAHPFDWFTVGDLRDVAMFDDARLLATALLEMLAEGDAVGDELGWRALSVLS